MFAPCVVIPVYDHEHAIGAVVASVRAHALPVLLVDDGSALPCAAVLDQLAQQSGVTLIRHSKNLGKGAAVCAAMREAHTLGFTHVVQVDADGQHTLSDLPQFVEESRAFPHSVICGRPVFDASIPRSRLYGRYLTHVMVWIETLSFDLVDSMCGFRLYPLRATIALLDDQGVGSRMDFDTEILVRLHWRNVATRWLDTRVCYPMDGVSHFRMFFDNVRMTSLHIRLTLGMLSRLPMLLARKFSNPQPTGLGKRNANA